MSAPKKKKAKATYEHQSCEDLRELAMKQIARAVVLVLDVEAVLVDSPGSAGDIDIRRLRRAVRMLANARRSLDCQGDNLESLAALVPPAAGAGEAPTEDLPSH